MVPTFFMCHTKDKAIVVKCLGHTKDKAIVVKCLGHTKDKAIVVKCLGHTSVKTGTPNHTLLIRNTRAWVWCS